MSKRGRLYAKTERSEKPQNSSWRAVDVKCPYYKGETQRAVVCEGLRAGKPIRKLFGSEESKKAHATACCCKDFTLCNIFQLVYGGFK